MHAHARVEAGHAVIACDEAVMKTFVAVMIGWLVIHCLVTGAIVTGIVLWRCL